VQFLRFFGVFTKIDQFQIRIPLYNQESDKKKVILERPRLPLQYKQQGIFSPLNIKRFFDYFLPRNCSKCFQKQQISLQFNQSFRLGCKL
jgi:hypothetical protein